jgi:hypothetical protein
MAIVRVSVALAAHSFPVGTVEGMLRVTLKGATESVFVEQEVGAGDFVFDDVPVGNYEAVAERLDAAGVVLGNAVSASFTVVPTSTDILVPIGVTVRMS